MKKSFLMFFLCMVMICLAFMTVSCVTKADGGVDVVPTTNEVTPFEGTWEFQSPNPQEPSTMIDNQYTFHLNTFLQSANFNALGIMDPVADGTFTYTDKTISLKVVNVLHEGLNWSLEGIMKNMPKSVQNQVKKDLGISDFSVTTCTYQWVSDEELLLVAPGMNAPRYGINTPEQRYNLKKVKSETSRIEE